MEHLKKVSIELPAALNAAMQSAVASGEYESASEVIQEALQDWSEKKTTRTFTSEELRFLWNEGKASGTRRPLDVDSIMARARERLERSRANSP